MYLAPAATILSSELQWVWDLLATKCNVTEGIMASHELCSRAGVRYTLIRYLLSCGRVVCLQDIASYVSTPSLSW